MGVVRIRKMLYDAIVSVDGDGCMEAVLSRVSEIASYLGGIIKSFNSERFPLRVVEARLAGSLLRGICAPGDIDVILVYDWKEGGEDEWGEFVDRLRQNSRVIYDLIVDEWLGGRG